MWQADITHWRLVDGQDVEILNMIDDHSRLFLASRVFPTAKAADVVDVFRSAIENSRPYHPQTCGKVERLHQTLKRYLARQTPAKTLSELQARLDAFAHYYNAIRPHRALGGRTPLQAYSARLKARPAAPEASGTHFRIRHDKVDDAGTVTLRHDSKLHHIGLGRAHKGKPIKLLVADRDIRVLDARTGELIRRLTLDPSRDYQPIGGS
ncbi:MAG TPA: integrase core domain-containing protein [Solirubrobacterales bacterium]|nr:integrase core domain-containing protein [Solirubrobacterales bacterium]